MGAVLPFLQFASPCRKNAKNCRLNRQGLGLGPEIVDKLRVTRWQNKLLIFVVGQGVCTDENTKNGKIQQISLCHISFPDIVSFFLALQTHYDFTMHDSFFGCFDDLLEHQFHFSEIEMKSHR